MKKSAKKTDTADHLMSLEKKNIDLEILLELASHIGSTFEISQIVNYVMLSLTGKFAIESIALFLVDSKDDDRLIYYSSLGLNTQIDPSIHFSISSEFCRELVRLNRPATMEELRKLFPLAYELFLLEKFGCFMPIALVSDKKLRGIFVLGRKIIADKLYSDYDVNFILSAIRLMLPAIENAMLYEQMGNLVEAKTREIREKEEYFREMALLLPTIIIETGQSFKINFINHSGKEVLGIKEGEDISNIHLSDFLSKEETNKLQEYSKNLFSSRKGAMTQFRVIARDGASRTVIVSAEMDKKKKEPGIIRWSAMDISPIMLSILLPDESFFNQYNFSRREKDILLLLIQGYKTKDVSKKLFLSENTIKTHISHIYNELDVNNREEFFTKMQQFQVSRFGYESFIFFVMSKIMQGSAV